MILLAGSLCLAIFSTLRVRAMAEQLRLRDKKMEAMAYHDRLTGMENRMYLYHKFCVESYLNGADRMGLIYINIDSFRNINDTYGHFFGDELLIKLSAILRSCLDPNYKLIHLGGDEFLYLVHGNSEEGYIAQSIQCIRSRLNEPVRCGCRNIYLSVSVGVSVYPDNGEDFGSLFQCADTALQAAKSQGKSTVVFYQPSMNQAIEKRMEIEQYLRSALNNDELDLAFQPQIRQQDNKIRGFEALLRWNEKSLKNVETAELISVAEDAGIIVSIGEWVMRRVCTSIRELNETHGTAYIAAVNLSPVELKRPEYARELKKIIKETGFNPGWLELEITENVIIYNDDNIMNTLNELLQLGIKIALDDFGTGYSSLSSLNSLPIHTLKIDRDFIRDFNNSKTRKMIESIIIMAHKLNLTVIAEGVEEEDQVLLLRRLRCDFIQGFHFSRPVPFDCIEKLHRKYS